MGDYGVKVTRDGYDVASASFLNQVFNSSLNTMKTLSRGTASTTASGLRTVTVASSLSFRPGFMAWFEVDNNGRWYPNGAVEDYTGQKCSVNCYIDNVFTLYADVYSGSSKTIVVKYILLADPGE